MGLTRSHQVPGHPGPARHDPMMSRHGAALGWAPLVARWDLHLRCPGWVRMLGQLGRCTSWICSWIVNVLHRSSWIPRVSSCPCINNPKTTLDSGAWKHHGTKEGVQRRCFHGKSLVGTGKISKKNGEQPWVSGHPLRMFTNA